MKFWGIRWILMLLAIGFVSPLYSNVREELLQQYRESLVALDPLDHDGVQEFFRTIYQKIRLPDDPEKMPEIFLINDPTSRAFVNSRTTEMVFFNVYYVLYARSVDEIAATFAHELRHFFRGQLHRRGTSGGRFVNEIDSEIMAILTRICRKDLVDGNGNPEPAAYNLESIIDDHQREDVYSETHPNAAHIASALTVFYAADRLKRHYPAVTRDMGALSKIADRILEAANRTKPLQKSKAPGKAQSRVDSVRETLSEITRNPAGVLVEALSEIEGLYEKFQNASDDKRKFVRDLDALIKKAKDAIKQLIGLNPDDSYGKDALDILKLQDRNLFSSLVLAELISERFFSEPCGFGAVALCERKSEEDFLSEASDLEVYIQAVLTARDRTQEKMPEFPVSLKGGRNDGLTEMGDEILRISFERKLKSLLSSDISFELLLPLFGYAISRKWDEKSKEINEAHSEFLKRIVWEDVLELIKSDRLDSFSLKALDGAATEAHRLPKAIREKIVNQAMKEGHWYLAEHFVRADGELMRRAMDEMAARGKIDSINRLYKFSTKFMGGYELDIYYQKALLALEKSVLHQDIVEDEDIRQSLLQELLNAEEKKLAQEKIEASRHRLVASLGNLKPPHFSEIFKYLIKKGSRSVHLGRLLRAYLDYRRIPEWQMEEIARKYSAREHPIFGAPESNFFSDRLARYDFGKDWLLDFLRRISREGFTGVYAQGGAYRSQALETLSNQITRNPISFWRTVVSELLRGDHSDELSRIDWNEIFSKISSENFMIIAGLPPNDHGFNPEKGYAVLASAFYHRFGQLLEDGKINSEEALLLLRCLTFHFNSAVENSHLVLRKIAAIAGNSKTLKEAFAFIGAVSPLAFGSHADYLAFIKEILKAQVLKHSFELNQATIRKEFLADILRELHVILKDQDAHLKEKIFTDLAELCHARPSEKELFRVDASAEEELAIRYGEDINALLEVFAEAHSSKKWKFLQWLRGHGNDLPEIHRIKLELEKRKIFIPLHSIERYLRARFEDLSPLVRGGVFLLFLNSRGFLDERFVDWTLVGTQTITYREKIKSEFIDSFSEESRQVMSEIYEAAIQAFPRSIQKLLIALIFSESGKGGSPERALRLLFSKLGPLVQKFGQTLAFDPNMPESYRKELQETWDSLDLPDWWTVQEMLKRQYGDLESAGFELVAIRNAGTTEIVVEVKGPDGIHRIVSLQREAIKIASEIDERDLRAFVTYLLKHSKEPQRFAFLELLVDDAVHTMQFELSREHRREMNSQMKAAYQKTAIELGGKISDDKKVIQWNGFRIQLEDYEDHLLSDGKSLVTRTLAPGIPLRKLKNSNPLLYKNLSTKIIELENAVQNDSSLPIDKDRMPGQYFFDEATMTLTILDPGQARPVQRGIHDLRDRIFGSVFYENYPKLAKLLKGAFGFQLLDSDISAMKSDLSKTEPVLRSLQVFHWLKLKGFLVEDSRREFYQDLIHAIRSKLRLAHWAEDLGSDTLRREWKQRAVEATPMVGGFLESCRKGLDALGALVPKSSPLPDGEEALVVEP